MAETVGDVVVRVGADIGDFTRGMRTASGDTDKLSAAAARAAKVGAAMGAALATAGAVAAGAMAAMAKQGLAFVDTQAKAARSVDATIDGLRALTLAGEEAGIASGEMISSMQNMARELSKAASLGGPAAQMLEALGLSAQELSDLDVDDRLAVIADRAKSLGLSAGQAAQLLQSMGVESRGMAAMMINGGDAIREAGEAVKSFGLSVSQEAAAGIEAANDAVGRMSLVMEGLRNKLAVAVAPALLTASIAFQDIAKQGGPLQESIDRVADSVSRLAGTLLSPEFIQAAASFGGGLLDAVNGLATGFEFLVENGEAVARMAAILGGAVLAMGGPIGWAIALLGGAAAAMLSMKKEGDKAAATAYSVRDAENALNAELAVFATSTSPAARAESKKRVAGLRDQARTALLAAESELKLAMAMNESAVPRKEGDMLVGSNPQAGGIHAAMMGEEDAFAMSIDGRVSKVQELKVSLLDLQQTLADMRDSETASGGVTASPLPTPELPGLPSIPGAGGGKGGGGADKVASDMAARLEALTTGLQTERETVELWYQEGLETINCVRVSEIVNGGHNGLTDRLATRTSSRPRA